MAVSAFRPEAAKRRSMNPNNNGEHHGNQDDQHHHHRHHHHRHHHQQQQQQQQQHHQQQQQQHQQQQHHHPQHRRRHHHQQDDQLDPHRRMIPCTSSSPPNRTIYTSKLDPPPCPADRIDRNDPRGRVHARSRQHCDLRPRPQASHELERSNRAGYHERQGSSLSEQYPDAQVEEKFVLSVHPQNDQETSSERVSQDIGKFSRPVFSEEILELFKYVCKFYMAKVEKAEEEVGELRRQLVDQRLKYMNLRGIVDRFMSDRGYKEYADGLHGIGSRSNRDLDTDGNASEEAEVDSAEEEEEDDDDDDDGGDDDDGDDDRVIGCEVSSRSDRIAVPDPSSEDDHSTSDSNMDGLVLPWLRWDATNNSTLSIHSGQRSTRQKQEASVCPQSCDEVAAFSKVGQKENHGFAKLRQRQVCDGIGEEKGSAERDRSVLPANNAHVEPIDEMPSSETCFVHAGNAERMSERIRFQSRIESRELLLCIGMLHYNAF